MAQDIQVQGPFEISPDGQQLLFASPRNGNFDIYVATLDAAGKDALKTLSSQTDLSPALAAAAQPTSVPASQPVAAGSSGASSAETGILPAGLSPYLVALAGLALVWGAVEGVMLARKRVRRRTTGSDGE
jgi:hypothetical protein